jgi:hypothetical protein
MEEIVSRQLRHLKRRHVRSPRVGHDKLQSYANPGFRAITRSPVWVQKAKYSRRADVFRFAPESGHCATESACPFRVPDPDIIGMAQ